ncbi:MAG TPA: S8 family serine peptidase [Gaiellaceae bacterium]|nr:S8 family serine peptidase [Gaiellaceae bacterium]
MRLPRAEPRRAVLLAAVAVTATGALLAARSGAGQAPAPSTGAESWIGLVAPRPPVALAPRVIVVLRAPSLAQRVAAAGGDASPSRERAWTRDALAAQRAVLARLAAQGAALRPDYSFSRVLDGFSARVTGSAVALLERDPGVAGVYPVRVAYPATVSTAAAPGIRAGVALHGFDGGGVTVALLDTGVDAAVPYLRGRVGGGIDLVGGGMSASETHGTEMAGLVVGGGGVATGAHVLPIRVAGPQPNGRGGSAVYARSDQLVAGLDRAVDPNDDGDAHDSARVALVALAEPFAAFPDSPEARAVAGALALDTLVVAPAGNDGAAAPGYGDVSAPGSAPAALTVGAADTRATAPRAHVLIRSGLSTLFAGTLPLAGSVAATRTSLEVAAPRASRLTAFFSASGTSLVAGRAALTPAGAAPLAASANAATAGAAAVLLYGSRPVPAGVLAPVTVPVVSLPAAVSHALLGRLARGATATVALADAGTVANPGRGRVASFSSTGGAKPDLVAPGVGLATVDPGGALVSVNGSSAAAAVVAGAAALLAQARPRLDAAALGALLAGTGHALPDEAVTAQGTGMVDVAAAAGAPIAASPAPGGIVLANVTGHALSATLAARRLDHGSSPVDAALGRTTVALGAGRSAAVALRVGAAGSAYGVVVVHAGGETVRVPWAARARTTEPLLTGVSLANRVLTIDAGRVSTLAGSPAILSLARLDVELVHHGLLARLRDVLPGRVTFALTGRDAAGRPLPPGGYTIRVVATPVGGGPASVRMVRFTLR